MIGNLKDVAQGTKKDKIQVSQSYGIIKPIINKLLDGDVTEEDFDKIHSILNLQDDKMRSIKSKKQNEPTN